ncbi:MULTISPECIES: type I-E CRISPR-associated endoribonuclease Cas2e [Tepidimonas]|jgi:CRISPR-associated endoribonuclease Cas2, subtype I-E/ECOLI|uniref:CRISPR-associated endoribonuclease Cas2 n=2 Tax=Tepidimonas TaxID=114248 RepID=A0A554X8W2_9BURK|nr:MULTISPECIES: type I-E CRISPR-associated endoribonuclease Cas2e [Tepidimonas]PZN02074.1 MAG: type I-E CRISPR-associated endoribonuclease Cas2 [Pseudomonadota bacterium]TSE32216.1 CRISPR-associated endoribonuclease Cas2 [Tepidimonas charontis]TSE37078.1 CRISPR-associated endoribonuclease Cas2 [Tepidimonas fonticaldi]
MSMTVVVTRNVSSRVRGFLASAMLELAPGVYSAPRISPAVRDRVWDVLKDWFPNERDASLIMIWQERDVPGGQAVRTLGSPPIDFVNVDGLVLARRPPPVGAP